MKSLKKITSIILMLSMLLCIVAVVPFSASAYDGQYNNGTLYYNIINNEVTITDCVDSASGELTIPETIDDYPVTSIKSYAFSNCLSITSVIIPNSVKNVGSYVFSDCSSLTSVNIPNSVTSIGKSFFYGCSSLTNFDIPNSVTSIGNYVFSGCSSLTNITIPNSVISIGGYAFSDCSKLASITIPNSVTNIGSFAFSGCSSLTNVNYGGSEEDWNNIHIYSYNECLTNAKIYFKIEWKYEFDSGKYDDENGVARFLFDSNLIDEDVDFCKVSFFNFEATKDSEEKVKVENADGYGAFSCDVVGLDINNPQTIYAIACVKSGDNYFWSKLQNYKPDFAKNLKTDN